jgi:hypothetical protein
MLAKRLPLLTAFASGGLSVATLFAFWLGGTDTAPALGQQRPSERARPLAQASVREQASPDDGSALRQAERKQAPEPTPAPDPAPSEAPPSGGVSADSTAPSDAEPGSSVADVLIGLEAAYRQGLAAPPAGTSTSAPASAPAITPPAPPPALVREVSPPPAASKETAVVAADAPSPPKSAPSASAAATSPTVAAPAPALVANARPTNVHVGDVHQNISGRDTHQGDVVQVQQVAVFQYLQWFNLPPGTTTSSPPPTRRPGMMTRGRPTTLTSITNPDNPWGFYFPPTPLVK